MTVSVYVKPVFSDFSGLEVVPHKIIDRTARSLSR